jgi:hypothetical protein
MSNENKTHYRKVFKSDHLGVADLEDFVEAKKALIFTIREVKQETGIRVAGKKGNFNIAYFTENIKPLVLNATNSKTMKNLSGGSSFVEDWKGITVSLYIDPSASFAGEITGGVRINPNPVQKRQELTPDMKAWGNAVEAFKRDGNLTKVLERMDVSEENQKLIIEQAGQ